MTVEPLLFTLADGIAHLRFNRPQVLNALDQAMAEVLRDAVLSLQAAPPRCVVLSGEGRAFMAGGDISLFAAAGAQAPAVIARLLATMHAAVAALAALPVPVIASIQGAAAGAGLSIALGADIAIAAEDASFSLGYLRLGAPPDCGGTWYLAQLLGLRRAMGLVMLDDRLDAPTALQLGLINRMVPTAALEAETAALAQRLAQGPTAALGRSKALLRAASASGLAAQLDAEGDAFLACAEGADFAEGVAAFLGRRPARFRGE